MIVALDSEGNRIYAEDADKINRYYCPVCNEELQRMKSGPARKPYFAHKKDTNCHYGQDKDSKCEWHGRMQEYFPRDAREVRFIDKETGEVHIADVFISRSNTILEFQHSPISEEEFLSRTYFHLNNGRRIAWLFDESSKANYTLGKFRHEAYDYSNIVPFYQWMYHRRQFLKNGPDIWKAYASYSICVYTGTEGDVFRRIVDEIRDFGMVGFSRKLIQMSKEFDENQLFSYDNYWIEKDTKAAQARRDKELKENAIQQLLFGEYRRNRRFR